jgi:hypothetical protein
MVIDTLQVPHRTAASLKSHVQSLNQGLDSARRGQTQLLQNVRQHAMETRRLADQLLKELPR